MSVDRDMAARLARLMCPELAARVFAYQQSVIAEARRAANSARRSGNCRKAAKCEKRAEVWSEAQCALLAEIRSGEVMQ